MNYIVALYLRRFETVLPVYTKRQNEAHCGSSAAVEWAPALVSARIRLAYA